ncbi:MAG TPA: hypothetical protein ENG74_02205 [Thermoplasmatales archaeon]|nr:hypothetical protein [Thermoplasmatales archaeon]
MKALIIAAGEGSRFGELTRSTPKPLLQVLGLTLIERCILSARDAGIEEFVVVTGYLGDKIRDKLGDGRRYGVKINYIENKEWDKGNGLSVLIAKQNIKERFILLMSDHIFDSEIIRRLLKIRIEKGEGVLVVDYNPKSYVDIADATKVKISDGKVVDIGKNLSDFDAVDCGIFLLSPDIFDAVEESIRRGDDSLSGGIKVLAEREKMKVMDIEDYFWIDVDTRDALKNAEKEMLRRLTKATDGPVSKYLNRPVSRYLSKLLVKTSISPDAISLLSFLMCILASYLFSLGDYLSFLAGGLVAQFASIVDGCDGEIARLKFQCSRYGAWLDANLDRYADALMILGLCYGYWISNASTDIWIVGFFALIGSFMNSYTAVKYDDIFRGGEKIPRFRIGRDLRIFLIMVGTLLNQIFAMLIVLAIITNAESVRRLIVLK